MYFDERFDPSRCHGQCDNCSNPVQPTLEDVSEIAYAFIQFGQAVQETTTDLTRNMFIDSLLGKRPVSAKNRSIEQLSGFGAAKGQQKDRVERIFDHLMVLGAFKARIEKQRNGYTIVYASVRALFPTSDNNLFRT